MEENAKNMTLDDYIDPSYRLNDFDKTRAQEIIDAFYEKYPKDGNWLTGAYSQTLARQCTMTLICKRS